MMSLQRPLRGVCVLVNVATLLVGICLGTSPARAQVSNPKITITVLGQDTNPLPGVPVTLVAADNQWKPRSGASPFKANTSKKGSVIFVWAKPDDYVVSVDVAGQVIHTVGLKMRDDHRRPVIIGGKTLEDKQGGVDPNNPIVPLSIPNEAGFVELTLTMGPPIQAASSGPGKIDIKVKSLNDAVQLIQAQDYPGALAKIDVALEKRTEMKPEDVAGALYMRGFALYQLKRPAEAEGPLTEALSLNPQLRPAMDLLSTILIDERKFPEASDVLAKDLALVTEPAARAPLLLNLALALREQKKDNEALAPLEEAYQANPGEPAIIVQLADLYTSLGRAADAEKLMSTNLPADQAATLNFNMAAVLVRQKNWTGAEQHFRKALELNPQLVDAHRYLGDTLLSQNKRPEALAEYEAFLAAAPNSPDAAVTKQVVDALKQDAKAQQKKSQPHGTKK